MLASIALAAAACGSDSAAADAAESVATEATDGDTTSDPPVETTAPAAEPGTTDGDAAMPDLSGQEIVVSTFPFGVEDFEANFVVPFEEATGATIEIESGSNADRLTQMQLNDGDTGVDVMLLSDYYAALGQQDELFQTFTEAEVPNLSELKDFATEDAFDGPAFTYQLNGILYRTDEIDAEEAADWSVFGNEAYSGRLALPDIAVTAGQLTIAGIAEQYGSGPFDIDTAFEQMSEWSPGILQFYSSTTEVTNLMVQGEIYAAPTIHAFAAPLVEAGEPISWTPPETGRYMATNRLMIPTGAPNADGAYAFINYLLSFEAQSAMASTDLPVRPEVEPPATMIDLAGDAASDPTGAGYSTLDPTTVVENRDEWVERFAREVSG